MLKGRQLETNLVSAVGLRIGIVVGQFNKKYTEKLLDGSKKIYVELGGEVEHLTILRVPGVVELPLACQKLFLEDPSLQAIVALGVVLRGETSHFDYVCRMCADGLMQVMLAHNKAIGFGVLTVDEESQIKKRTEDDQYNKGSETMLATIQMCLLKTVSQPL